MLTGIIDVIVLMIGSPIITLLDLLDAVKGRK